LVDEVVLYETQTVEIPPRRLKKALGGLDAVTFTSASTVKGFLQALRRAGLSAKSALDGMAIVAIGPATAQALKAGGISQFYLPKDSWTIDGLIEALVQKAVKG
jgi:uroporphyrinogen III methyltransferase/synthase